MLHITRGAACRGTQELLDHLPANRDWMPVFALMLRNYSPHLLVIVEELVFKTLDCLQGRGRTIHKGDNGGIASAIKNGFKSGLQGTELAIFRMRISHQVCGVGIYDRCNIGFILTRNHNDQIREWLQRLDGV